MAALVNSLDNYTGSKLGEKGHIEYGWSNSIREQILQFSFQLTRTNDSSKLQFILINLLTTLKNTLKNTHSSISEKEVAKGFLSILYKMIGYTRDIIDGKGEYTLTYMMIYTWYEFYPELAQFALKCLVDLGSIHQYGSWKDIKYFCKFCKTQNADVSHSLIRYAIKLVNEQLAKDLNSNSNDISLAAKWVPREKSSFGWLYETLATDYYSYIMVTADTDVRQEKAVLKCKTEYRKLLSSLNRKIDTLQIKQCSHTWSAINFDKVTSISLSKQKKAFLNIKKDGAERYPENVDRVICAKNFTAHVQKAVDGKVEMKGKRIGLVDFTKQALDLLKSRNQTEIDLLNSQWRDSSTLTKSLGNMIAMVDVSGSMEGDPLHAAIALGIRIAEKSALGKRVLTFSARPSWVNLDSSPDFVSQVNILKHAEWGMNTNFYAALDLILNSIIENKMAAEDVQDLILAIVSDMQIDAGDSCDKTSLYEKMKQKYAEAGMRVHGTPFKPPHILFWNLRSTSGFPTLSSQPNCSMMSGFSPALLNIFCEQGITALQACTPWSMLEETLENERYTTMGERLGQEIVI